MRDQQKEKSNTSSETVEVPDPWNVDGKGPFILETKPHICAILSAPKRSCLAMAYMRHPVAEVRAATIRFLGSRPRTELMVGLVLAQRLAVDREDVQRVAAETIWKRGREELQWTMNYLAGNDESPGDDGNGASVSREDVRIALQILHDANPSQEQDFRDALLYGWCWHDDQLAALGRQLIGVWFAQGTFLDEQAKTTSRAVGADLHSIGGLDAMEMMFRPVRLLAGITAAADDAWLASVTAADELNDAWSGIGGWRS